jgi:hypothetical protein
MAIDALTTATQNMVVSYSASNLTTRYLAGQFTSQTIVGPLVVQLYVGKGRLVRVCALDSNLAQINFYNTATPVITPPTDWLFALVPTAATGLYEVGQEFINGLVVEVPAGTTLNVTYSVGQ